METIKWIEGLIAFTNVAESGSFSKAASALKVSKSHISKCVSSLEEELGFALLVRSTRKIQLTTQGEAFLSSCQESLRKLTEAKEEAISLSQTPRGVLRVTLAGIFGENFIAPVALKLLKKYPELKIELDFNSKIVNLIEDKFDVAIRFGHLQDSSLRAQKIASRREFVCCTREYAKHNGIPQKPEELYQHQCLGSGTWNFKKAHRTINIDIKSRFKSNNPRVLLSAALNDIGIVRLPGSYVFKEMRKGKLIPLLEDYSVGPTDIWAVTANHSKMNVNIQVFIEEVKKYLNDGFPDVLF